MMSMESKDVVKETVGLLAVPPQPSVTEAVVERLRAAILHGHFAPGERLREESLAKSMGVSRGPIRVALSSLVREGLVIIKPNHGAQVARLSRTDLDEVYSLRLALEHLAVERAARLISESQLNELANIVKTMDAAVDHSITEQEAAKLDMQFHETIYLAAQHQRLYDCWADLRPQIHILLLMRTVSNLDFREMVVKGHRQIYEALAAHDANLAATLMQEHITISYERVTDSYQANHKE